MTVLSNPQPQINWSNPSEKELFEQYRWAKQQEEYLEESRKKLTKYKDGIKQAIGHTFIGEELEDGDKYKGDYGSTKVKAKKRLKVAAKDRAIFNQWLHDTKHYEVLNPTLLVEPTEAYLAKYLEYPTGVSTYQYLDIEIYLKNQE